MLLLLAHQKNLRSNTGDFFFILAACIVGSLFGRLRTEV